MVRRFSALCLVLAAALAATSGLGQETRHVVPLFSAAEAPNARQGFVRVVNISDVAGEVSIEAFDDAGVRRGPVTLSLGARQTRHFNSKDLQDGNAEKGLSGGIGAPTEGAWRLTLVTRLEVQVLAYMRTGDGFLTSLHDLAPQRDGTHHIATFNPGSNQRQVSKLRLVNPGQEPAAVTIRGVDDEGHQGDEDVVVTVVPGAATTLTAGELEARGLGTGQGKWRLEITADQPVFAMSLLDSPTGHRTNLSTVPANATTADGVASHRVPLFPPYVAAAASDASTSENRVVRQGFVRVVNRSAESAVVTVTAFDDDAGADHQPVTLTIAAGKTIHFNSRDLQEGNAAKGLSGGVGTGVGNWRLRLDTEQDIQVLAYVRTSDGFLTSMHDVAPATGDRHEVAIFNPGRNTAQRSLLRLINAGAEPTTATIAGVDDQGNSAAANVVVSVQPGTATQFSARQLEELGLGAGTGKWRLTVASDRPIAAMSLLETPTGHLTNLSTISAGVEVQSGSTAAAAPRRYFAANIAMPIVQNRCINCHVAGGPSGHTRLVFVEASNENHEEHNVEQFKNLVDTGYANLILRKIRGLDEHGGGAQITAGSTDFANMQEFLRLLQDDDGGAGMVLARADGVGYPTFASPHARPIAVNGGAVYVANTPADTVDVIDASRRRVVKRIQVGVDPVSVAVRPDGLEVWVANHVSDTVSVIDADPASSTFQQVIATVQDVDARTLSTNFDEPMGIAFADNRKAYVALSTSNRIAVVDVEQRRVTNHLPIRAQDPRAIAVRGNRLYVLPFESNNQSQLSGCRTDRGAGIDGDLCTFDAVQHVFTTNNVLSENYDADIIKNPNMPDRDLFVFDTGTDRLVHGTDITGLGTLLYGLAVDSTGRVFVAQTDARNVENGRAGTRKHGLTEMENRAFLNQITRLDCLSGNCARRLDLEPLPPRHPDPGAALATPFAIQVSADDATLVVTAAGSDRLFTMDARSGDIHGRVAVGAVPRGVALVSDRSGAASEAWVLNAVENSVSLVDLSTLANPTVVETFPLQDPTHPVIKQGRIAFNDADASSTGTFSCESCHPDGHTDQLLWVLHTPNCGSRGGRLDRTGCTQVPPRLTMPVRGLRDTQPYHWDGIPGDPYGGRNTRSIDATEAPNCSMDDAASCTRHLVDGSLATTMCQVVPTGIGIDPVLCEERNDEGKAGLLDAAARDALAQFILNIPYPPAQTRPFHNVLTTQAQRGFFEFSYLNDSSGRATGAQTCGACHKMPFLVSTNTPGTGMDAPTWRGAYDRWTILPQARTNIVDLLDLAGVPDHIPERDIWTLGGATPNVWQMVTQGSTGFAGSFARQTTLNRDSADDALTASILDALETSAQEGAVILQAEGVRIVDGAVQPVALQFDDGVYVERDGLNSFDRATLIRAAEQGDMVLTLTGRAGANMPPDYPPPALWPESADPGANYCANEECLYSIAQQRPTVNIAFLTDSYTLQVSARHVHAGASIFIDGRRVGGTVRCALGGALPSCADEILLVQLQARPEPGGLHFLQLQNADGLFSNDMMFFSEQSPLPPRPGNLISSGGTFNDNADFDNLGARRRGRPNNWNTVELVTNSISIANGQVRVDVREPSDDPWHAQLSHAVMLVGGQQYTLCYRARAQAARFITAYIDTNMYNWRNVSGGQFRADLTRLYRRFEHTFTIAETDLMGRVAFDFAQSDIDVFVDDIGVYEGSQCGQP